MTRGKLHAKCHLRSRGARFVATLGSDFSGHGRPTTFSLYSENLRGVSYYHSEDHSKPPFDRVSPPIELCCSAMPFVLVDRVLVPRKTTRSKFGGGERHRSLTTGKTR